MTDKNADFIQVLEGLPMLRESLLETLRSHLPGILASPLASRLGPRPNITPETCPPVGVSVSGYDIVHSFRHTSEESIVIIQPTSKPDEPPPFYSSLDDHSHRVAIFRDVFRAFDTLARQGEDLEWLHAVGFRVRQGAPIVLLLLEQGRVTAVKVERTPEPDPFLTQAELTQLAQEDMALALGTFLDLKKYNTPLSRKVKTITKVYPATKEDMWVEMTVQGG